MSYSKPWKVCQDYGLGVASADLARTNLEQHRTSWTAEHGEEQASGLQIPAVGHPYDVFGHHNTAPVPRAIVRCRPTGSNGLTTTIAFLDNQQVVRKVSKLATGTWAISMHPDLQLFFGCPRIISTSNTDVRLAEPYSGTLATGDVGILVKTYNLSAGDFVLADLEFSCAIYSYA